ncbi:MAG TPA: hypothetical protein PK250_09280 [Syntrophobacter fumaroxidans]|nr:hypothetical protein [Syntrophobacter fumaroxidans]
MEKSITESVLETIAGFYDERRYGYEGFEGYRKSTDLFKLAECAAAMRASGYIDPERTVFADLGCADGRVNVLMSYFVKTSIGIEIDPEILSEYPQRKEDVEALLREAQLPLPPPNIFLLSGSSLEPDTYRRIFKATGVRFSDIDLFYTYITLHDVFAGRIENEARPGALYLVYGFGRILPRYERLELLVPDPGGQGIAALYVKRD